MSSFIWTKISCQIVLDLEKFPEWFECVFSISSFSYLIYSEKTINIWKNHSIFLTLQSTTSRKLGHFFQIFVAFSEYLNFKWISVPNPRPRSGIITLNLPQYLKNSHNFFWNYSKGTLLYYVREKGWVGGIAKYLLFLTGVGGWFWITLT